MANQIEAQALALAQSAQGMQKRLLLACLRALAEHRPLPCPLGGVAMTDEALNALFGKADYSHIARDATVTVSITAAEMAALLGAYDRGLDALDQDERDGLNAVISKLKDELWP